MFNGWLKEGWICCRDFMLDVDRRATINHDENQVSRSCIETRYWILWHEVRTSVVVFAINTDVVMVQDAIREKVRW